MMTIKQFEEATGLPRTTVRFYEAQGLLAPEESASGNGYRLYGPGHVERARTVRLAQSLGFSVREIRALMEAWESERLTDSEKRDVLAAKRAEIRLKRRQLETLEAYFDRVIAWYDGGQIGPKPGLTAGE